VRWFWRFIMCPLLFGIIGTQMNFNTLPSGTIPKAFAIIFAGDPECPPPPPSPPPRAPPCLCQSYSGTLRVECSQSGVKSGSGRL